MGNNSSNQHAKRYERLECLESLPEPELPNFVWGSDLPGSVFCDRVSRAYEKWFTREGTSFHYLSGRPLKPSYKKQATFKHLPRKLALNALP